MEFISVVLAVAILALAAIDLFRTVLDYDGYGPISQRLYRLTWSLFRIVATRLPGTAARGVLASAGPAMLLASVATWILLAAVGFALVYLPWMRSSFVFDGLPGEPLLDALYFSVVSLSTVGFGDIVATHQAFRILAAIEALTGFAIITLTISYLLGVYQVVRDQSALAALVEDQAPDASDHCRPPSRSFASTVRMRRSSICTAR